MLYVIKVNKGKAHGHCHYATVTDISKNYAFMNYCLLCLVTFQGFFFSIGLLILNIPKEVKRKVESPLVSILTSYILTFPLVYQEVSSF